MQVPLMEFIEDHRADALELWVRSHLPKQQGLGDKLDARLRGFDALKTYLVTDFTAQLNPALLGNACSQKSGRDTAWLEDDDLSLH